MYPTVQQRRPTTARSCCAASPSSPCAKPLPAKRLPVLQCARTFCALECIFRLLEVGGRHLGDVYQVPLSNTCRHNSRTQCRSSSVPAVYARLPYAKWYLRCPCSSAAKRQRSRACTLARGSKSTGNACGGLRARCACLGSVAQAVGGGGSSAGSARHKP